MDANGRINDLGRQYIGEISPNTTPDYVPGVVTGGDGGRPEKRNGVGDLSRALTSSPLFGLLAAVLFVVLLV